MIQFVANCIGKYKRNFTKQEGSTGKFSVFNEQASFTKRYNCSHKVLKVIVTISANGKSKQVVSIIDTGCTNTSIPHSVIEFLALIPSGHQKMSAVNKSYVCNFYICSMIIEGQIQIDNAVLMELPQLESESETETPTANEEMILGMDILSKCDFAITNQNGNTEFSMAYPSKRNIDFTKE